MNYMEKINQGDRIETECGSFHKGLMDTSVRLHLNKDKELCAKEKCLWVPEGKSLMDGVVSVSKGQRGQGRRQSSDWEEHGGRGVSFCSTARGSLWRAVI